MLGDIGDFLGANFGEIGHHPWQAAGAALGVPGFDPAIGGLFNNRPGGALLSPTGNFTSSAWHDMYQDNPNNAAGLDAFHRVNSIADVVAPMIAGYYGAGSAGLMGNGGGGSGLTGLFGGSGGSTTLGPDIQGSGSLFGVGSGMGGSTMTGTATPGLASANPYASAFGGTSMEYPFTMQNSPVVSFDTIRQMMQMMQQSQQQGQQRQPQGSSSSPQLALGNPVMHNGSAQFGPSMPYSTFNGSGGQAVSPLAQMLAMRGGI